MSAFKVTDYLRDLDMEIYQHESEIVRRRARIHQLQEMRATMMIREEEKAAALNQPSPFGRLPEGIQMVVRDPSLQPPPDGALSLAAKTGEPVQAISWWKNETAAYQDKPGKKPLKRKKHMEPGVLRSKIAAVLLAADRPLHAREICDAIGVPHGEEARKPVHNCVYNMRLGGFIEPVPLRPGGKVGAGAHVLSKLTPKGVTLAHQFASSQRYGNGNGVAAHG